MTFEYTNGLCSLPGDLITNTFTFDVASGAGIDGASITRGSLGVAAAEAPFQGSFHFHPSKYRKKSLGSKRQIELTDI